MRIRAAVAFTLLVCIGAAQPGEAQTVAAASPTGYIVYSEDAPCPPTHAPARVKRPNRLRRPHRIVHRKAVRAVPRVQHAAVRHRVVKRRRAKVLPARIVRPRRCTVLRREPLTAASFGLAPEQAVLTPIADEVEPGGPLTATPSSGRVAMDEPVTSGVGGSPGTSGAGGTGGVGGTGGGGSVSAAPEPTAWLLLMVGVGALGMRLRRRTLTKRGLQLLEL